MASLYAKLIEGLIKWLVMPLLSKLIVSIVEYFQEKKAEAERNEKIDNAVKEFKEAQTDKEKEDAFRKLVRSRGA